MAAKAAPEAASTTPPSISPPKEDENDGDDTFEARRTSRVSKDFAKADGEVWQENLTVGAAGVVNNSESLVIRSYYVNQRTGQHVWDEPPSGASKVLPATEDMRRLAQLQMHDMQLMLGAFPEDTKKKSNRKKEGGMGGLFRWKSKSGSGENNRKTGKLPGGSLAPKPEIIRDETMDPDIQKAISMSLGVTYEHPSSKPKIRAEIWQEEEDDAVAMARALSLSAAEANCVSAAAALSLGKTETIKDSPQQGEASEEAILASVLEQSRLEAETKLSEEAKCAEDVDLLGLMDTGVHDEMGHSMAFNADGTRSPIRTSLSPIREEGRNASLSPKPEDPRERQQRG